MNFIYCKVIRAIILIFFSSFLFDKNVISKWSESVVKLFEKKNLKKTFEIV